MNFEQLTERTVEIRQTNPSAAIKQRMADAASELSRAGENQKRVELLQEACFAMTKLCYEIDQDGQTANVDSRTHRLLVPAPWGRSGWKRWGLRAWEAAILGRILRMRCEMQRVPGVFDYNTETGKWYLNYGHYQRLDQALMYWKSNPITLKDWRLFADAYRHAAHERMNRRRGMD